MYAKSVLDAWMKSEFRTNFGVLSHREGTARGVFFLAKCLCFYFESHTHSLKLESNDLVTFVFGFEKSPRIWKSWNYVHGFVLSVYGFVLVKMVLFKFIKLFYGFGW